MSTVDMYTEEKWPILKGDEIESFHFREIRRHMWLMEHPYAGNIDITVMFGKWVGSETEFKYIPYDYSNWEWESEEPYHYGWPIVLFRWGMKEHQVDLFVWNDEGSDDYLNARPPVVNGKIHPSWKLYVDPNKYSHWSRNAGRPDIGAEGRWIISQHGYDEPPDGVGWMYGIWRAYEELPTDTDPRTQLARYRDINIHNQFLPVERDREQISQYLWTIRNRSFKNTYIGSIPTETWWWDHWIPNMLSEYARLDGDPMLSSQVGDDYRCYKKNTSYQDRIVHLIEQNYWYVTPCDDFFKKAWNFFVYYGFNMDEDHDDGCVNPIYDYAWCAGGWSSGVFFYEGDCVWGSTTSQFYRAIQDSLNVEPGVTSGWEDYWVLRTMEVSHLLPEYIDTDPLFVQFSDYLHHCNSSAFEKVLKQMTEDVETNPDGEVKYDWYFDDLAPAFPWHLYQEHTMCLTQYLANGGTWYQDAFKRFPPPRGCWRRVWRYTHNWDTRRDAITGEYYRTQRARFGKEIEIDGKMVSMMWPGELGNPPGYDEQLQYFGTVGSTVCDYYWYRLLIDQTTFDNMERPVADEWQYIKHYIVVPVEEMFKAAYKSNKNVERLIRERHDPQNTDWKFVWNEDFGRWEWQEFPLFETYADMINDMRCALLQLKYIRSTKSKEIKQLYWGSISTDYSATPEGAYALGRLGKDYDETVSSAFEVGYSAFVYDTNSGETPYKPWYNSEFNLNTAKALGSVSIITYDQDFPTNLVGTAMIRVKYRTHGPYTHIGSGYMEDCTIGFGDLVLQDERPFVTDLPYLAGYLPLTAADFQWVYEDSVWKYKCEHITNLLEDWPPEEYFAEPYPLEARGWSRAMDVNFNISEDMILCIDFNGYDETVFDLDPYDYIQI